MARCYGTAGLGVAIVKPDWRAHARWRNKEAGVMESTDRGYWVQLAGTEQDFCDACSVRAAAYGHHDPEMGAKLGQAEVLDKSPGTVVVLCRDSVIGQQIEDTVLSYNRTCPPDLYTRSSGSTFRDAPHHPGSPLSLIHISEPTRPY